mgnify:FL=1
MSQQPKILISKSKDYAGEFYIDAIRAVGGEPVSLYAHDSDEGFDALLLSGGGDMASFYFGEENHGSDEPDLVRDAAEMKLCDCFIRKGKPVLGICRGHQVINIYFGGTLVQDLPTAALHSSPEGDLSHPTVTVEGSVMHRLFGASPYVNTSHHKGIKVPGKGLKVTQYSQKDGVIEAIEHESLPVLGVQWHPERMCLRKKREDTPDALPIFAYFLSLIKTMEEK